MLTAALLAATVLEGHSLSAAATGCLCITVTDRGQYGGVLDPASVAGGRLQYDYSFASRAFVGATFAHESVWRDPRYNAVWMLGGALGKRWGKTLIGGLRVAAGVAGDLGRNTAYGGYLEFDGEFAVPTVANDRLEFVVQLSIIAVRSLSFTSAPAPPSADSWGYATVLVPTLGTIGFRLHL